MVMPALPGAQFVVVQAQFALTVGKAAFNRPAHPRDSHQLRQTGLGRGIAEIELPLWHIRCSADFVAEQQPDLWPWQPVAHRQHPHRQELGHEWPFVPFQHPVAFPGPCRPRFDELFG